MDNYIARLENAIRFFVNDLGAVEMPTQLLADDVQALRTLALEAERRNGGKWPSV